MLEAHGVRQAAVLDELAAADLTPETIDEIAAEKRQQGGGVGVVVQALREQIAAKQRLAREEAAARRVQARWEIENDIREAESERPNTNVYRFCRTDGTTMEMTRHEASAKRLAWYEQHHPSLVAEVRESLAAEVPHKQAYMPPLEPSKGDLLLARLRADREAAAVV